MDYTKRSVSALAEPLAQMLRLVDSGLKFCKERLKYGRHNSFSTPNLKCLKTRYRHIRQPPEVVLCQFYMFARFPIAK